MLTGTLSPVSNQADWIECFGIDDAETGEPIDLSEASEIEIEICEQHCGHGRDYGTSTRRALQSATLSDETITLPETGIFEWSFTAAQMQTLCAGTYDVRLRITKDDIVTQLLIGTLPVLAG
jgi:hypothetical protein